jgi:hypothetical protein
MSDSALAKRSIQEFWIDFLLEEELQSDPQFAAAFCAFCGLAPSDPRAVSVQHSVSDVFGEADLLAEFVIDAREAVTGALLIENKINAGFQPQQAERYRSRGEAGIVNGRWHEYRTILVAPAAYLKRSHGFDAAVSLEMISGWLCSTDDKRRAFKQARLQRAIDKKNLSGVQVVDPVMTAFRGWYAEFMLAREDSNVAGFVPPVPRPAYFDDNWIQWTSKNLPPACRFRHLTRTGIVDLSFANVPLAEAEWLRALVPPSIELKSIGKYGQHASLSAKVTPITDYTDLVANQAIAEQAQSVTVQMQKIVLSNGAALSTMLGGKPAATNS